MSDMANSDLEKYAKALDKSVEFSFTILVHFDISQRHHEVPRLKDGRSQRYDEASME